MALIRRRRPLAISRSLAFLLLLCLPILARAEVLQGKVVAVADGDTIIILDANNRQHRVRLNGIDAPESRQALGTQSKKHLSDLIFGKHVTVEYTKRDRYGRNLGKIFLEGKDINLEQIKAGLAWHYKQYERDQSPADRRAYAEAERAARTARYQIWAEDAPTPPWEFRRTGRELKGSPTGGFGRLPEARVAPSAMPRAAGQTIGNRRSKIYHRPDCPNYGDVSPQNRVLFKSAAEAERAGYRMAKNCP